MKFPIWVDEAEEMKPLVKSSLVEVELPSAVAVQGKAKLAVPQAVPVLEMTPMEEKVAQPAVELPADETTRSVVEATVVESVVVVAFTPAKFCKVEEDKSKSVPRRALEASRLVEEAVVLKRLVVVALPETKKSPSTESLAAGVEVPMPTKPLALIERAALVEVAPVAVEEVAR